MSSSTALLSALAAVPPMPHICNVRPCCHPECTFHRFEARDIANTTSSVAGSAELTARLRSQTQGGSPCVWHGFWHYFGVQPNNMAVFFARLGALSRRSVWRARLHAWPSWASTSARLSFRHCFFFLQIIDAKKHTNPSRSNPARASRWAARTFSLLHIAVPKH